MTSPALLPEAPSTLPPPSPPQARLLQHHLEPTPTSDLGLGYKVKVDQKGCRRECEGRGERPEIRLESEAETQVGLECLRSKENHRKALNWGMPVTTSAFRNIAVAPGKENGLEVKTQAERRGEAVAVICFEIMLGWTRKEAVPMGKSAHPWARVQI